MTIANPAAGHWRVVVDGFAVPAGSTQYNYVDVFAERGLWGDSGHGRKPAAGGRCELGSLRPR